MKRIIGVIFSFFLVFSFLSCKETVVKDVSFYHWQTDYSIGEAEQKMLSKAKSKKLYIKFFDLLYMEQHDRVYPVATLQMDEASAIKLEKSELDIISVIYITNEVFLKTKPSELKALANETLRKIYRLEEAYFNNARGVSAIQIDCDWSLSTKDSYFTFLELLQEEAIWRELARRPVDISATIRLHQVKFVEKTGVPPVSSGSIMFYNTGDLLSIEETNSIINVETTASYLSRLETYPLPYNVALPVFGWNVLYRDSKLAGILSYIEEQQLADLFTPLEDNWYEAKEDSYINRTFVYKGDKLRVEDVSLSDFKKLHKIISKASATDYDVVLYHINSNTLKNTDIEAYLEILR